MIETTYSNRLSVKQPTRRESVRINRESATFRNAPLNPNFLFEPAQILGLEEQKFSNDSANGKLSFSKMRRSKDVRSLRR